MSKPSWADATDADEHKSYPAHRDTQHGAQYMHAAPYERTQRGSHSKQRNHQQLTAERQQGYIISMTDKGFGFIECIDASLLKQHGAVKNELFVHISDVHSEQLFKHDEVEFDIVVDRDTNKLQAVNVSLLPPGTVSYEVILQHSVRGQVVCELQGRQQQRGSRYGAPQQQQELYGGRVQALDAADSTQYEFAERDLQQPDVWLCVGDRVTFDVFLDKRVQRKGATNIHFDGVNPDNRLQGTVISVSDKGFGFIAVANSDTINEIYFHYTQLLQRQHKPAVGDEFEFTVVIDDKTGKSAAHRIAVLPAGTIKTDTISSEQYTGTVTAALQHNAVGTIQLQQPAGSDATLQYTQRDLKSPQHTVLLTGDTVAFNIKTKPDGSKYATNITLQQWSTQQRVQGVVTLVKDGFSFIDCIERSERIFIHHSNVFNQLHTAQHAAHKYSKPLVVGDELEFNIAIEPNSERESAVRAVLLPRNTVKFVEVIDSVTVQCVVTKSLLPNKVQAAHTNSRFDKPQHKSERTEPNTGTCKLAPNNAATQLSDTVAVADTLTFTHSDLADTAVTAVLQGDTIQCNVKLNKRTKQQSATNIHILQQGTDRREHGIIRSVAGDTGKIDCLNSTLTVTFYAADVVTDSASSVQAGSSVEFNIIDDFTTDKIIKRAVRIQLLPKDSVVIETVDYEHPCKGIVESTPVKHSSKLGLITMHPTCTQYLTDTKHPNKLRFRLHDVQHKSYLVVGDAVQFYIATRTVPPHEQFATQLVFEPQQATVTKPATDSAFGRLQTVSKSSNSKDVETLVYGSKDLPDGTALGEQDVVEFSDVVFDHKARLRHAKKLKLVKKFDGVLQPAAAKKQLSASSNMTSRYAAGPPEHNAVGFKQRNKPSNAFDVLAELKQ